MDSRRLHIWQPVTCLERAQIINATLNYTDRGLCLTLIDRNNAIKCHLIQNYVWSFRYTGEIPRSDLVDMVTEAMAQEQSKNSSAELFYKMSNSDYIEWFDQLLWIGIKEIPTVEHHIYCYNDGVLSTTNQDS